MWFSCFWAKRLSAALEKAIAGGCPWRWIWVLDSVFTTPGNPDSSAALASGAWLFLLMLCILQDLMGDQRLLASLFASHSNSFPSSKGPRAMGCLLSDCAVG